MKLASTIMAAASLALVMPSGAAVAQRGGHGGRGFHGGGFSHGGSYRYRGGYGYRGYGYRGYGYRGYGYGGYGFGYGLFGLGVLGGYALGSYPRADYGYAPYAYDVDPELYDAPPPPPPPPPGYAAGALGYDDAGRSNGDRAGTTEPMDGEHCPMFWDQAQKRYVTRCG